MSRATELAQFAKETGEGGQFQRQQSRFREWVRADGSSPFKAEPGRYHLYASYACPWAHRAILLRALKGLDEAVGLTIVDPVRDERGWRFRDESDQWGEPDPVNGWTFLSEAYTASDPAFDGRVTTPTLWDKQTDQVVSNESADVVRMLNAEFNEWAEHPELDLYPEALRSSIDEINAFVYDNVNNGVYKTGFATTQAAYEESFDALFAALDRLEEQLSAQRYLAGDGTVLTETDWRLWMTLVRFDAVYVGHFKCNLRRIADYPSLSNYTRELYQVAGVADTVRMDHIKRHYYATHPAINPTRIVPKGPELDFSAPHDRTRLPAADAS